ncbi:tannase-domain-containing protein [Dendrothele bispora CBS 962.96]|uniref:Carboxylic ester hydrolase n=1 Tax=Dendrothele bispora (strain CBS 962.96) TaxID=1314807 RepID=A0A4S8M5Q9_DENBC|nr:tannase-domain-containing protein [Dendrothele bispora CBS 962.96]
MLLRLNAREFEACHRRSRRLGDSCKDVTVQCMSETGAERTDIISGITWGGARRSPKAKERVSTVYVGTSIGGKKEWSRGSSTGCGDQSSKRHVSLFEINHVIPNATVFFSELVLAGTDLALPDNDPSCEDDSQLVLKDICRISMFVTTSNRSGIHLEAWFPRDWTGRMLTTGNGGLSGCIQYIDLAYGSALGFATIATNNGHNGTSGAPFLNNPDILEDFAYRSIHTAVQTGTLLTSTFYSTPPIRSYYSGCSTGGRQGLKSVQDFLQDFDGVVVGSPTIDYNHLIAWAGHFYGITGNESFEGFVTQREWMDLVHGDVMRQCDEIDGVRDGVIEDPNLCEYDPEGLVCGRRNGKDGEENGGGGCLTEVQVETVRKVYEPFYIKDELVFPRMQPGSEYEPSSFLNGKPSYLSTDWFRYVIYNNPSLDPTTLSTKDWILLQTLNPFNISTWSGNLSSFRDIGGKLLLYHGQADRLTPKISEWYYEHVAETMGIAIDRYEGDDDDGGLPGGLDDFFRFFRISGMGHCLGGPGAWGIGQMLPGAWKGPGDSDDDGSESRGGLELDLDLDLDPERNVLMAMVRWVEEGIAPEELVGTKWVNDRVEEGLEVRRSHCRYPLRNTYDGVGDPRVKESWKCL